MVSIELYSTLPTNEGTYMLQSHGMVRATCGTSAYEMSEMPEMMLWPLVCSNYVLAARRGLNILCDAMHLVSFSHNHSFPNHVIVVMSQP